jgi:ligand-binding sensor domain-containing protein
VRAILIVLACCRCAFALNPSLDVSQYAHTAWTAREGFFKGGIWSIAQTSDGYLWVATSGGLELAQHIEAELIYADRQFQLRIRDDGQGIAAEIVEEAGPGITVCRGCGSGPSRSAQAMERKSN